MKVKTFFIILFALFILHSSYADNYYADIQIYVNSDGSTNILGNTNYPPFINVTNTQLYTSKKADMWTLNITTNENFESFVYELTLPENSNVNYIKTTPKFRIENEQNKIKIIGIGEDKPLTLVVQYQIKPLNNLFSEKNILLGIIIVFIISLLIIIIIGFRFVKKLNLNFRFEIEKLKKRARLNTNNNKTNNDKDKNSVDTQNTILKKEKEESKHKINLSLFSERQQEIITILLKKKKITQKELEVEMKIPKSSISRNVQTLVVKGVVLKETKGMTNYLSLRDGGREMGDGRSN